MKSINGCSYSPNGKHNWEFRTSWKDGWATGLHSYCYATFRLYYCHFCRVEETDSSTREYSIGEESVFRSEKGSS